MFALFFSLYISMFTGRWIGTFNFFQTVNPTMKTLTNSLAEWSTSLFSGVTSPMKTLGNILFDSTDIGSYSWVNLHILIAYVLALITSIGIVVLAVKGIKRIFAVFFTFGR